MKDNPFIITVDSKEEAEKKISRYESHERLDNGDVQTYISGPKDSIFVGPLIRVVSNN